MTYMVMPLFGVQAPYSVRDWRRKTGRKWKEALPPWIYQAWHFIVSRALGLRSKRLPWVTQPAAMAVPITTPQVLERLGCFKDKLRPFTVVTVPFPKKEPDLLWKGYFIMPYREELSDLGGRPMVNVASGETFYIHDNNSPSSYRPLGWLRLTTMDDEIDQLVSRAESKFCTPNGSTCTSKTIGLLVRKHIVAGEFHYIGKEASTRWGSGPDLSMLPEAGALDPADETAREYERVADPTYLEEIRSESRQFSTKLLSRQARVAECSIRNFKNGKNTIRPRTLRTLTRAIHDLQNKKLRNQMRTAALVEDRRTPFVPNLR
jgi:hypothetical protein